MFITRKTLSALGVHRTTMARWRAGTRPNACRRIVLDLLEHGIIPLPGWDGWRIVNNGLIDRDGNLWHPGDIAALPMLLQAVRLKPAHTKGD